MIHVIGIYFLYSMNDDDTYYAQQNHTGTFIRNVFFFFFNSPNKKHPRSKKCVNNFPVCMTFLYEIEKISELNIEISNFLGASENYDMLKIHRSRKKITNCAQCFVLQMSQLQKFPP